MGSYGLASHFSSLKEICRGMPRLGNQAAFNTSSQASLDMLRSVVCPAACMLAGACFPPGCHCRWGVCETPASPSLHLVPWYKALIQNVHLL